MRTDRKITLAVGLASVLVVAVAGVGLVGTRRLVRDGERVLRSHAIRAEFQQVSRHIDAAEADARGLLLTGDGVFLARQRHNVMVADSALRRLTTLTPGDAVEQERLVAIRTLVLERAIALEHMIAIRARGVPSIDEVTTRLSIGDAITNRIDSLVDAANAEQGRVLATRLVQQRASERLAVALSIAFVLATTVLVGLLGHSIRRDFIGRTRAEAALRASEAKFAGILSIAADAIITIDEDQRILHFNRGAEEVFGYREAEVLGKQVDVLIPTPVVAAHRKHVRSFVRSADMARRTHERREIEGRRKNGEHFPAEASISKLQTPDGWIFTAMLRDISERKRLLQHEHAIAQAGVLLARSLDYEETLVAVANLPVPAVGVWSMLDVVEGADASEPPLRRLAGRATDPAVGRAVGDWAAKALTWDSPEVVIDVLRTGKLRHLAAVTDDWLEAHLDGPGEIEIARRVGIGSLLVVPLVAGNRVLGAWTIGSAVGRAFDTRDESLAIALAERAAAAIENAKLFRRAQRATEARDRVLSIVSHDLRNPLSAVSMLARRLVEQPARADEVQSIGAHVLRSVEWMHRLMKDLLDASSIDAGKLSVEAEPQSIHQIVDAVIDLFGDQATERGIELRVTVPPSMPWALADASRIIQVFGNLVGNALKFTAPGGSITIGARSEAVEMVLWVRDTGAGIPVHDQPHVFDRFWQARRNAASRGSGLGLAIARGIVNAHGGRIWVDSVVGEGSTFFFTLPIGSNSSARRLETLTRPEAVLAG